MNYNITQPPIQPVVYARASGAWWALRARGPEHHASVRTSEGVDHERAEGLLVADPVMARESLEVLSARLGLPTKCELPDGALAICLPWSHSAEPGWVAWEVSRECREYAHALDADDRRTAMRWARELQLQGHQVGARTWLRCVAASLLARGQTLLAADKRDLDDALDRLRGLPS